MFLRYFAQAMTLGTVCVLSTAAYAATTYTETHSFAPVGLAATETAQISVTDLVPSSNTTSSCSGTISFVDASGNTIGTATNFTVTSGQTFSASLPHSATGASGRVVIRGVIYVTPSTTAPTACALISSMETYDTGTGVTHAVLTFPGAADFGPGGFGR